MYFLGYLIAKQIKMLGFIKRNCEGSFKREYLKLFYVSLVRSKLTN
jgi:hypothetical protein